MVSVRSSSNRWALLWALRWALRFQTAVYLFQRQAEWSADLNSTWTLSAATRCPMMTQDAVHFSGAVSVGSRRASTACFTGRQVNSFSGAPSTNPLKIAGKKVSRSGFSTGPKASPIPGVTCCRNTPSCWSGFCSLEKADCGCLWDTPGRVPTDSAHPPTFLASQLFSAAPSHMNPPR